MRTDWHENELSQQTYSLQFQPTELRLLQACVGFHARSQTDPALRDQLYRLWCKLNLSPKPESPTGGQIPSSPALSSPTFLSRAGA